MKDYAIPAVEPDTEPEVTREAEASGTDRRRLIVAALAAGAASLLPAQQAHARADAPASTEQSSRFSPPPPPDATTAEAASAAAQSRSLNPEGLDREPGTRSSSDRSAFESIVQNVKAHLKATSDGTSRGDLADVFKRIDSGFKFTAHQEDADFNPFHVEPLLDQAADLLDRGVRDRAQHDDLAAKALALILDVNEYVETDAVVEKEVASKRFDYAADLSLAARNAENAAAAWGATAVSHAESARQALATEANKIHNARIKASWVGGLLHYSFNGQSFGGYVTHTYAGDAQTAALHYKNAAIDTSNNDLGAQFHGYDSARLSAKALEAAARFRASGLAAQVQWDRDNRLYQRQRLAINRKYNDLKSKALSDPDGAFNYIKRMEPLRERFQADVRHAVARLKAAQKGLLDVYGFDLPVPANEGDVHYYDDCLLYVREAIQRINRFSRLDQNCAIPLSVKRFMGTGKGWENGQKQGRWDVNLPATLFPGMRHVRLRGISAFVRGDKAESKLWTLVIRCPGRADSYHLGATKPTPLEQSNIPPVRLGRVTRRSDARDPDVSGVMTLYNASPIGTWSIRVEDAGLEPPRPGEIADIHLELHVTYRAEESRQPRTTGK